MGEKFDRNMTYIVQLLSASGEVVSEEHCSYYGMDNGRHVFKYVDAYFGVEYGLILIPEELLDRYKISEHSQLYQRT